MQIDVKIAFVNKKNGIRQLEAGGARHADPPDPPSYGGDKNLLFFKTKQIACTISLFDT